jgi:(2Fe-2S) ferredoxin
MSKPEIEPYDYHVMLCCGSKCVPDENRELLNHMKSRLLELGLDRVRVNRAGCLGVCKEGPIMVVHPDGVWYCHLNRENVDRIIEQHLRDGSVVRELAFHQAALD